MATIQFKENRLTATVDSSLKNHSNDAFVLKKLESAKSLIKKVGLPKAIKK